MKTFARLFGFMMLTFGLHAQVVICGHVRDYYFMKPLQGANIDIPGTEKGTFCDSAGFFSIRNVTFKDSVQIRCHYFGFKHLTVTVHKEDLSGPPLTIFLMPDEIDAFDGPLTITVPPHNSRLQFNPQKTEIIGSDEMANTSPLALHALPGMQLQLLSAVTGSKAIRMQGLDSRYTLLLRDGMPLYDGLAHGSVFEQSLQNGLHEISVLREPNTGFTAANWPAGAADLKQLAGNTGFGIAYAQQHKLLLNAAFSGSINTVDYAIDGSYRAQRAGDIDADGYLDIPDVSTFVLHPRIASISAQSGSELNAGMVFSSGINRGGLMDVLNETGNFSGKYFRENRCNRNELYARYYLPLGLKRFLTIKSSYTNFDRKEKTNFFDFGGRQTAVFVQAVYSFDPRGKYSPDDNETVTLVSDIRENRLNVSNTDSLPFAGIRSTVKAFAARYTYNSEFRYGFETSLRCENPSGNGWLLLPSLSAVYHLHKQYTLRISGSTGYGIPDGLEAIDEIADGRALFFKSSLHMEKSIGGNVEWNYCNDNGSDLSVTWSQLFFITRISNPVRMQIQPNGCLMLGNISGRLESKGIYNYLRVRKDAFETFLGYTYTMPTIYNSGKSTTLTYSPVHQAEGSISCLPTEEIRLDAGAAYTGYQYREDGSKTKPYVLVSASVTFAYGDFVGIIKGENLNNVHQSRYEPVVTGSLQRPSFARLWAPVEGRSVHFSLRVNLER